MSANNSPSPFPGVTPTPTSTYGYYTPESSGGHGGTRKRRFLIGGIGIAAVILLGLGGGAAWAANSHGDYPYQYVAAGATGYVQLNMSPSMLQQAQLNSFLSKLPKVSGTDVQKKFESRDDVVKLLVNAVAPGNSINDYSWAGDRYAVIAYGDQQDWSDQNNLVYVFETKDSAKAIAALQPALARSAFNYDKNMSLNDVKQVKALGGNYIGIGTDAALTKAADSAIGHLDKDAIFTKTYSGAGDPLSYWADVQDQVSTGSIHADWNSLELSGMTTGNKINVTPAEQAANKTITANNSVANPMVNVGLAVPVKIYGSKTATGKALLTLLGTYGGGEVNIDNTKLDNALSALGDNVSYSSNKDDQRLLLHGTTEAKLNAALTEISGQPTSVREIEDSSDGKVQVQTTKDGVLIAFGSVAPARPADLTDLAPGALIARVDIDAVLKATGEKTAGKWGRVDMSVGTTDDGTSLSAKWQLP